LTHARHLSDGDLRRFYDDPYSLEESARAHYDGCAECQAQFATVVNGAGSGRAPRLARGDARRLVVGGLAAAALAGSLVAALAFTPLAATVTSTFAPADTQPVAVAQTDVQTLSSFQTWGNVNSQSVSPMQEFSTAADASTASGLPALTYDSNQLPASVKGAAVSYAVASRSQGTVVFNSLAPTSLRGSTLTVTTGSAQAVVYGDLSALVSAAQGNNTGSRLTGVHLATTSVGAMVAIIESPQQQVSSTGASVDTIKSTLLSQPNLSTATQSAIRNVNSPVGNLPIPVPAGTATAQSVTVQGLAGTAYADANGPGNAIVWIDNGMVYAVAGTVSQAELLQLANTVNAISQAPTPSPTPVHFPPTPPAG
jgi:hypothetical protein